MYFRAFGFVPFRAFLVRAFRFVHLDLCPIAFRFVPFRAFSIYIYIYICIDIYIYIYIYGPMKGVLYHVFAMPRA